MADEFRNAMGEYIVRGDQALKLDERIEPSKIFKENKSRNSFETDELPISLKTQATMNDVFVPIKS